VLNELARKATGEYLFFASEALEVDTPEWCEELLRVAQEPGVGVVTAMAYSAVERLLHEGFILKGNYLQRSHVNIAKYNRGQRAILETMHEISAVDATCAMVRHELFNEVGGFNESLAAPWDMVDFSLRLREKGLRKILNFGHTIGHALETYFLKTQNKLFHGEAIAMGMIAEAFIAAKKELLTQSELSQISSYLIHLFGKEKLPEAFDEIINLAGQDKKNRGAKIKLALPNSIGKAVWDVEVTQEEIAESLTYYQSIYT
jgi:hypothetical protein